MKTVIKAKGNISVYYDGSVTVRGEPLSDAVKAALYTLADSLAKKAIIQQPDFTKKNMTVGIDSENPDRINVKFPVKLSGNVTVSSSEIFFGFYLGE